jgi:hypothetical protein
MNKVWVLSVDHIGNTRSNCTPIGIYSSLRKAWDALEIEKEEHSKFSKYSLDFEINEVTLDKPWLDKVIALDASK